MTAESDRVAALTAKRLAAAPRLTRLEQFQQSAGEFAGLAQSEYTGPVDDGGWILDARTAE